MLEGTAKIGHVYGTFDRNLDIQAVRDLEEGGTQTLPSQKGAQLNIYSRIATAVEPCGSPSIPRF